MVIARISDMDVLSSCREILGLPNDRTLVVDDRLVAGLLRRSAGIYCPCSRATLRTTIIECLQHLPTNEEELDDIVDSAIEAMIVGGDLLEFSDVVIEDCDITTTSIFAASPSFVVRPNGNIFVFGIVPDQDIFLPKALAEQIIYKSYYRIIESHEGKDFVEKLSEYGLQQVTEEAWLKCPRAESASSIYDRYKNLLDKQEYSGSARDMKILAVDSNVRYYLGRWTTPAKQTGTFVGRRPQEYGAPIWCFARFENGILTRFIDLPFNRTRWRGCDVAWHLQMAIDHCRNAPQRYRKQVRTDGIQFDFFSPLPLWAERRLMIFGQRIADQKSLFSYDIPDSDASTEEDFLRDRLWLCPTEDSD